ncbi:hypothetical protein [Pyxidicoccus xibeiensis]|uniref:hypothetical protein n=1 Tax=Pyxidicoccus xibeiensis TaxID=2906759 RepID=UPI0020A7EAE1|nr:hypothetical protein [Pyxidicoccus xibeiensis]MCP3136706.1 hypothetical protein [Pyxidicoccus xibeiensis]
MNPPDVMTPVVSRSSVLLLALLSCACSAGAAPSHAEAPPEQDGAWHAGAMDTPEQDGAWHAGAVDTPGAASWSSGTVLSYGADPAEGGRPPLEGLAEFVSEDRILFGERLDGAGMSVSLVRAGPDGLRLQDQRVFDMYVDRFFGSWDWSDRFTTFFIPLGNARVVAVGSRQRLELLDLAADRIDTRSRYALSPVSDSILSGAGRGDRFWTCSSYWVTAWRVAPDGTLSADTAQSFALPAVCRSLALSPDGTRLLASTQRGFVSVDVSLPTPVVGRQHFPRQAFFQVQAHGAHVLAQELVSYGGMGRILVLRAADLNGAADPVPVKTFAPRNTPQLWEAPVGFLVNDAGLLVEWFRVRGATRAYEVESHALTDAGVSPVRSTLLVRESDEVGLHVSPLGMTGRGRHAVVQPWRRVLEVEPSGAMRFHTGVGHGSLERLWVGAEGDVTALGPFAVHRLTLGPSDGPAVVGGGMALAPGAQRLRLLPRSGEDDTWELATVSVGEPGVSQEAGTARLSCLRPGLTGFLEERGSVRVAGGPAALATARGQLFQVALLSSGEYRVRRFALPRDCDGTLLAPEREDIVRGGHPDGVTPSGWSLVADEERGDLLLGEAFYDVSTGGARFMLSWFSGDSTGSVARGELPGTTDQFTAMALARDRAVVIENGRQVYVLGREGERIAVLAHTDLSRGSAPFDVSRILAFDGSVAWLALNVRPSGVVALSADDLSVLARHETPSAVRSIAFTGGRRVMGMNNAVTVAPETPPLQPR